MDGAVSKVNKKFISHLTRAAAGKGFLCAPF